MQLISVSVICYIDTIDLVYARQRKSFGAVNIKKIKLVSEK